MRKVFTYSRKKPFMNFKSTATNKENSEDLKKSGKRSFPFDSHKSLITTIVSQSADSSGDTPQTKRHKDIKNLLSSIDCKLKFLDLNENADFHKFYRHKNIILAEIPDTLEKATLSDLLKLVSQLNVYNFTEWYRVKSE